jgi:hypothetical protein
MHSIALFDFVHSKKGLKLSRQAGATKDRKCGKKVKVQDNQSRTSKSSAILQRREEKREQEQRRGKLNGKANEKKAEPSCLLLGENHRKKMIG